MTYKSYKAVCAFTFLFSATNSAMDHQNPQLVINDKVKTTLLDKLQLSFDTLNSASRFTYCAIYNHDGTQLATYLCDDSAPELEPLNKVMLWDAQTRNCTHTLQQTDDVTAIAYNNDGQHIAIATINGQIHIWNAQTGMHTKTLQRSGYPIIIELKYTTNNAEILALTQNISNDEKNIETCNLQINKFETLKPHDDVPQEYIDRLAEEIGLKLIHDPQRNFLAMVSGMCVRGYLNAQSHEPDTIFQSPDFELKSLAYNPHHDELAIQSWRAVYLYNIALKKCIYKISRVSEILSINYSPDGKQLAVVAQYGGCRLYNLEPLHTLIEKIKNN